MAFNQQVALQKVQEEFKKRPHAFVVGCAYAFKALTTALILTTVALIRKGKDLPMPFLLYLFSLFIAERIVNSLFIARIERTAPKSISSEHFEIRWPMNLQTYASFVWVVLDILVDYSIIQWAVTSSLSYNLIICLLFGSKAIGIALQSLICIVQKVEAQLWTSFLIVCLIAYWVIIVAEMKPIPQIVLAVVMLKGLLGNFLSLARIKLAQNSEVVVK